MMVLPDFMAKKTIEVNLLKPKSIQVISLAVILMAVSSVFLNTHWQPLLSSFSFLALAYLGGLFFIAYRQAKKIKHSVGVLTHLWFDPQHVFVKAQSGQMCQLIIKYVWWHTWGFTLIGKLCDPCSHNALTHTLTVWRSQNTSHHYRWASICLSNQASFPQLVKAA
jgi:hypothetical protein